MGVDRKAVETLLASGEFDSEWYARTYPDVAALGMESAAHYLQYGFKMGRDPGPGFSATFVRRAFGLKPEHEPISRLAWLARKSKGKPTADPRFVLIAASEVAKRGEVDRAIALATETLPPDLLYTVEILRANAGLARNDAAQWLQHLNAYLAHFDVTPVTLHGTGESVFGRLVSPQLSAVMGGPLISVLMPAWNAEKTVRKAADSILKQTWRNLELLIVDDASEDATWSVLQDIAAHDARVKIQRNAVNVGPYVSKNIALTQARGEWITGHDADDLALPERLEIHMGLARSKGSAASLTYMVRMEQNGSVDHFSKIGDFSFDAVARVSSISTLFDAGFLRNKLGFWDSVRFGADSEMISRARVALGNKFRNFETIGMLCLDAPGSLTNDPVTGIRTNAGLSPIRSEYKSVWTEEHGKSRNSDFYLPFPQESHRYGFDDRLFVDYALVARLIKSFGKHPKSDQLPTTTAIQHHLVKATANV